MKNLIEKSDSDYLYKVTDNLVIDANTHFHVMHDMHEKMKMKMIEMQKSMMYLLKISVLYQNIRQHQIKRFYEFGKIFMMVRKFSYRRKMMVKQIRLVKLFFEFGGKFKK